MGGARLRSPQETFTHSSGLYLGGAPAQDERWVVLGLACLQVHLQTFHRCTLIFQVRVVVLLLQMKEMSLQDTLASWYTHKQFMAVP
jgi:hypothetical protein